MVLPTTRDDCRVEPALLAHPPRIEQFLGPGSKRSLEPFADRNPEARLRAIDQRRRNMPIKKLAKDMLSAPALDLERDRDSRREFGDPVIEKGNPGFEADCHRGAIDLGEDVVGQIGQGIAIHHPRGRVGRRGGEDPVEAVGNGAPATAHRRSLGSPFVEKAQIDFVEAARRARDPERLLHFCTEMWLTLARQQIRGTRPEAGWQLAERAPQGTSQRSGHTVELFPKCRSTEMPVVACEQFVAAIPRKRDRHLAASEAADQIGRDLRSIGKGLVVHSRKERNHFTGVVGGDDLFPVNGAKVARHRAGIVGLVIALFGKSDREGPHPSRTMLLIKCHDCRAVDPARQEGSNRHIGNGLVGNRLTEHAVELGERFGLVGNRVGKASLNHVCIGPVTGQSGANASPSPSPYPDFAFTRRIDLGGRSAFEGQDAAGLELE